MDGGSGHDEQEMKKRGGLVTLMEVEEADSVWVMAALMVQPTGSRKAMSVRELVERYEALEDELRRERTEVRRRSTHRTAQGRQTGREGGGGRRCGLEQPLARRGLLE